VKPETRTVTQLFELSVRYVVPLYQRPYVWNEEDQWEPLWSDIMSMLDHQLCVPWSTPDGHHSHFLGALVLEQETQAPGRIPLFTVIDGQQRLTTLQVLLTAAADVAADLGCEKDSGLLRELVLNDWKKASGNERFKVWPTNASRAAFTAVIEPGDPTQSEHGEAADLIQKAYAYFTTQVMDWAIEEADVTQRAARIEMLRITLCDLLKVVTITLESDDNAQVIFETLNARGTPFLPLTL
jgi:uncharacterized protein with ParB-like and HNH nuclease domain